MQSSSESALDGAAAQDGAQGTPRQLSDLFTGHRLTPVQRRIAAHIIGAGSTVAFHSSVELAEQSGVSQPSVTRFATALGYSGFSELQRAIQALVLDQHSPPRPEADRNKMQRAVQRSIDLLIGLRDELSDLSLTERGAGLLATSSVLPVYGSRAAAPLASQFQFFASKIHPDTRFVSGGRTEAIDQIAAAAELGATAMLAVALPRYPSELLSVLKAANRSRLKVVLVIDSPLSSLTELADVVLAAPVNTDLVFDSAVVAALILSIILETLADSFPSRTRQRLESFERRAAEEHYFLDDEYGPIPGPRTSLLGSESSSSV